MQPSQQSLRTFGRRRIDMFAIRARSETRDRPPRRQVRIPATIEAGCLHGNVSCMVTNISSNGAQLRLSPDLSTSRIYFPEEITLKLTQDRREVTCRVVYRDGLKLGIAFKAPFRQAISRK